MANDFHDARGRFTSGSNAASGTGDHQAVSPSQVTRNVPGHGTVARSKPVARHAGAVSLGTERPMSAKEERRALNIRADESSYHRLDNPPGAHLLGPIIQPGKLNPANSTLISGGPKPRIRVKAR